MTSIMPRERQLQIIEEMIERVRGDRYEETVLALKSVAADLRAKIEIPRSNTLGELERRMERLYSSKTSRGYDQGRLIALAQIIVSKWPTVRQALEQFGEESAE